MAKEKELLDLVRNIYSTKGEERTSPIDQVQDPTLANLENSKEARGQLSIKLKQKYKHKTYKKTCISRRV